MLVRPVAKVWAWWMALKTTEKLAILCAIAALIGWGVKEYKDWYANQPRLTGQVIFSSFGVDATEPVASTTMRVAVYATLQNDGKSPVTPENYFFEVNDGGSLLRFELVPELNDQPFNIAIPGYAARAFHLSGDGFVMRIGAPWMLLSTDLKRPITPGATRSGWLWFQYPRMLQRKRGRELRLVVVDATGNRHYIGSKQGDWSNPAILFRLEPCLQVIPPPPGRTNPSEAECREPKRSPGN